MDEWREQIAAHRFFGSVLEWKGTHGWIMPQGEVDHPLASKRDGKLYVAAADTEAGELDPGANVAFNIYEDMSGLGAFKCKVVGSSGGKGASKNALPKWLAAPGSKADRQRVTQTRLSGTVRDKKPGSKIGWIKAKTPIKHHLYSPSKGLFFKEDDVVPQGTQLTPGMEVTFFVYVDVQGIGAERVMEWKGTFMEPAKAKKEEKAGKGKGKGRSKGPIAMAFMKNKSMQVKKPGKKLPRKRLSSESQLGEVVEWKGTFGWINPDEPLDHPQVQKKGLYVRAEDVLTGSLEKGQRVNFHIYEDSSGLGAEECIEC